MSHDVLIGLLGFFLAFPVVITLWPPVSLLHRLRMRALKRRVWKAEESRWPTPPTDEELVAHHREVNRSGFTQS